MIDKLNGVDLGLNRVSKCTATGILQSKFMLFSSKSPYRNISKT